VANIRDGIVNTLNTGGYFVVFVSEAMLNSTVDAHELKLAMQADPKRVLPVFLERLSPTDLAILPMEWGKFNLELFDTQGDGKDLDWRNIDRMIVDIYHMVQGGAAREGWGREDPNWRHCA
jgi:hypothetical protein